jgi:glycolate oxidase FAD binding subunit
VPSTVGAIVLGGAADRMGRGAALAARGRRCDATARASAPRGGRGGHATLFRGGDKNVGVFQPLAPAVAKHPRTPEAGFDPAGIFNPGRMY